MTEMLPGISVEFERNLSMKEPFVERKHVGSFGLNNFRSVVSTSDLRALPYTFDEQSPKVICLEFVSPPKKVFLF